MKVFRNLSNRRGFTLVEVMAVMAIMTIVIVMIYSMVSLGINSLNMGQKSSEKQYEVRMAADFLSKQLRYANSLNFVTSAPSPVTGKHDIYLDGTGVFNYNNNGVSSYATGVGSEQKFKLVFTNIPSSKNSLSFTLGDKDDSRYDITTEVILLNYHKSTFPTVPGSCIGITYTLPPNI